MKMVKSGDTFICRYKCVDYIATDPDIDDFEAKTDFLQDLRHGDWSTLLNVKINDDLARLRPMVFSGQKLVKLIAVIDGYCFVVWPSGTAKRRKKENIILADFDDLVIAKGAMYETKTE